MLTIYVLSDPFSSIEKYKVGSFSGSLDQLITRYVTALPQVKIHYFIYHEKALEVETQFKSLYENYRICNRNGNQSEWFIMPLLNLLDSLFNVIREYKKEYWRLEYKDTHVMGPTDDQKIIDYWSKIIFPVKEIFKSKVQTQPGITDEMRLQMLKNQGVKYRSKKLDCQIPEEFERYTLANRINRKKHYNKTKTPSSELNQVEIQKSLGSSLEINVNIKPDENLVQLLQKLQITQ